MPKFFNINYTVTADGCWQSDTKDRPKTKRKGIAFKAREICYSEYGPPPGRDEDFDATHSCHNKRCVNPEHIRWLHNGYNCIEGPTTVRPWRGDGTT